MPWVKKVVHLGVTLESDNSMKTDVALKRGRFIGKVNSLMQEFHWVQSDLKMKLINIYVTSFYGSPLWDIFSADCGRLYSSWNVTVRNTFELDRTTHRYLVEPLSGSLHPQVMLASRLVKFHKSLVNSSKFSVRFLARIKESDLRTVMGNSLDKIKKRCLMGSLEKISPNIVKKIVKYGTVPPNDDWGVGLAVELLDIRNDKLALEGFSSSEVEELLTWACVN